MIRRHDLAVLVDGREDREVGAGAERADLGHLQRPETAREGELRVVGHVLAAKDQHRMLLERGADLPVCVLIGRDVGDADAAQLGAEARTQRDDFHRRVLGSIVFVQVSTKTGRRARNRGGPPKTSGR